MRLVLEQKRWPELDVEAAQAAPLPHIVLHPSLPIDERIASLAAFVRWNVGGDSQLRQLSEERSKSIVEWPIRIIEAEVVRAGDVTEARVIVSYGILEYWTAVMWRGARAMLEAERPAILKALVSGRPDWRRREIIALIDLYR